MNTSLGVGPEPIEMMRRRLHHLSWFAGLALMLAGCASDDEFGPQHEPSGLATPLPDGDFMTYISRSEETIDTANRAAGKPLAPAVIADRAPFELEPERRCPRSDRGRYERAVLMIHDVNQTPYVMRDLGRRFAAECYLVRAVLLPGHGTVPGDLLEIQFQSWRDAVRRAVASFDDRAENLYLVGFGAGATLALDYVLRSSPPGELELAGLVLLAPVIEIGAVGGFWGNAQQAYTNLLGTAGDAYSDMVSGTDWIVVLPENDPVSYESVTKQAGTEVQKLALEVVGPRAVVELPVFVAISADDGVSDPDVALDWFCSRLNGPRRMIWYTTDEPQFISRCSFITERQIDRSTGILNVSHAALPVSPKDPIYGAHGTYPSCGQYAYEQGTPEWFSCSDWKKTPQNYNVRYGAISSENLAAHVMRELTYNPDFDRLADNMLAFLDNPQ